jgi:Uma2 family endonuclease
LANYHHDLAVLTLHLKLRTFYPDTAWISERKLKHDKYKLGVGQQGHLPDGILVFPDNKQIAIEVELSCKSKQRLEAILKTYTTQFSLQEVWYFCRQAMLPRLQEAAKKIPFVKIHSLSEFLEKKPTDLHVNAG